MRFPEHWLVRLRIPSVLTNRVLIGAVVFFVLVGLWEFRWKPQYRPLYEVGVAHYQAGRFQEALQSFQQAYEIAPNSLDVIMMLGWAHYKANHFEDARYFFDRALRINPDIEEARLGSAFVALETGRGQLDVDLIRQYLGNRRGDPGVRTLSAAALARGGRWFEAAAIYRDLLTDRDYGEASRLALEEMYGLRGTSDQGPAAFPEYARPDALQVDFWAGDGALWRRDGAEWRQMYVAGVNFGAATPGYYPSRPLNDAAEHGAWLTRAAGLNANVVRVYNLLPPAFYRAFESYRDAGGTLTLFQQVYIGEPPGRDLFEPGFVEQTRADIRHVIDALHGRGEVPPGPGRRGGIYDQDVSAHVAALLVGRELEPSLVAQTNVLNAGERRYLGRFVQVADGTPTEVWIARMLDYAVEYETQTYNRQRPVAFVNWPSLDPFTHQTEAPILQELRTRLSRGEQGLEFPTGPQDDDDVATVDEAKLAATAAFVAGIFAAYHVYPHWPDFLLNEPGLLDAKDSAGPNPFFGYVRQLAARVKHPLVIAEYGASNAMGRSRLHPLGWHHGGLSEGEQSALVARLARAVREAGAAGGVVYGLHDEWYKRNWLVRRFKVPADRATLWFDDMDPDQRFGLFGFRPSKWPLFTRDQGKWQSESLLARNTGGVAPDADGFGGARTLRALQAAADEAYLYLRLAVDCLECVAGERRPDGRPRLDRAAYAFAISTQPGALGVQRLPWGSLTMASGATALVVIAESGARLLVADNYNPFEIVPTPGLAGETDWQVRFTTNPAIAPGGTFTEVMVEPNRRRYTRDGREIEPRRESRAPLRHGLDDPGSGAYDSRGEWFADVASNSIVVRIPWGDLFVTDPSSREVFAGFDGRTVKTAKTPGIEIAAFALTPTGAGSDLGAFSVAASLPAARDNAIPAGAPFTWTTWDTIKPEAYPKQVARDLPALFAEQTRGAAAGAGPARPSP